MDIRKSFLDIRNSFLDMGNSFSDIGNSFTDIRNSFMDTRNSFMDIGNSSYFRILENEFFDSEIIYGYPKKDLQYLVMNFRFRKIVIICLR